MNQREKFNKFTKTVQEFMAATQAYSKYYSGDGCKTDDAAGSMEKALHREREAKRRELETLYMQALIGVDAE